MQNRPSDFRILVSRTHRQAVFLLTNRNGNFHFAVAVKIADDRGSKVLKLQHFQRNLNEKSKYKNHKINRNNLKFIGNIRNTSVFVEFPVNIVVDQGCAVPHLKRDLIHHLFVCLSTYSFIQFSSCCSVFFSTSQYLLPPLLFSIGLLFQQQHLSSFLSTFFSYSTKQR